jgi:O-antigen/teichoic acid export membrane protein
MGENSDSGDGLGRSIKYTIFTQIPTQLFGIIAGIFITRILGPEGRGVYAVFYADIALFSTLLSFSISTGIIHFFANKEFSLEKIVSIGLLFTLITVLLSIIALTLLLNLPIAAYLFPSDHLDFKYLLWFILYLSFNQINSLYSAIFQGAKRFSIVNKVLIINSVLNLLLFGMVFLLDYFGIHPIGIYEILLIGLLIITINIFQWHVHYRKHFSYKIDRSLKWKTDIKKFFYFSGLGHLSIIINFFNYRLVLWIVSYYLDNKELGIFALGAGLSQLLTFISTPLSQVLLPYLSAENAGERLKTFQQFSRIHFSILVVLGLLALLVFAPLIPFIYGQEFAPSTRVFQLILLGIIFSCHTKLLANYFISSNKIIYNFYATLLGFCASFIFNIILVKSHGINGAAVAQTITYATIFLVVFVAMLSFTGRNNWNVFFVTKKDIALVKSKLVKR